MSVETLCQSFKTLEANDGLLIFSKCTFFFVINFFLLEKLFTDPHLTTEKFCHDAFDSEIELRSPKFQVHDWRYKSKKCLKTIWGTISFIIVVAALITIASNFKSKLLFSKSLFFSFQISSQKYCSLSKATPGK